MPQSHLDNTTERLKDLIRQLKQGDVRHVDPQRLILFLQDLVSKEEEETKDGNYQVMYEMAKKEITVLNTQLYTQYKKYIEVTKESDYLKAKLKSCEDVLEQLSVTKLK
tara:strand:- start:9651 stop:9977 length:327 start_codon:yes stop_codon:yes gene_type:complete